MFDKFKKRPNGVPPAQAMQTQFKLIIDYNAFTGQISVSGPLNNRMLSYGMLKMAELAVQDEYEKEKRKSPVQAPPVAVIDKDGNPVPVPPVGNA